VPSFANLSVEIDPKSRTCWCRMRPRERPSFTPDLLSDMRALQQSFKKMFAEEPCHDAPLRYVVVGSDIPGIFNLGGDLSLFAELIRAGDGARLHDYARSCIDVIYDNAIAYSLPIVTIAMVQGDALGGGFEAALSCNIIVAERSARFGLPEVLFNLFPGMGAYSFLSRRLGPIAAEKMIISGRVYEAAELHGMGLVDILADDGEAPAAVRSYIARHRHRHNVEQAMHRLRQRVNPIEYRELSDVIAMWVEAALRLSEHDLRKMERIMSAQNRRWATRPPYSAAV
jgi:DSF synthase